MEAFIQQVRAPSGTACHLLLRMIKLLVNSSFLIKKPKTVLAKGVRFRFRVVEITGLEPVAYALRTHRSTS